MKAIELVVDKKLAKFLQEDGELDLSLAPADDVAEAQALECGLETAAAIVTIVTGAITIGELAVKLTSKINKWLVEQKQAATPIVSRGETDDNALAIDQNTDPTTVEQVIAKNVFEIDETS